MKILCAHCGLPEDDHCHFRPAMPDGCICPYGTWGGDVDDICHAYKGSGESYCETCAHNKECHRSEKGHPVGG